MWINVNKIPTNSPQHWENVDEYQQNHHKSSTPPPQILYPASLQEHPKVLVVPTTLPLLSLACLRRRDVFSPLQPTDSESPTLSMSSSSSKGSFNREIDGERKVKSESLTWIAAAAATRRRRRWWRCFRTQQQPSDIRREEEEEEEERSAIGSNFYREFKFVRKLFIGFQFNSCRYFASHMLDDSVDKAQFFN